MVVEEVASVGKVAGKTSSFFLPFGKINLIITLIVFSILLVEGSVASVQEHSVFPLFDKAIFPVIAADSSISSSVDNIVFSSTPKPSAWFKYPFSGWFWERVLFALNILGSLWFIYFFFLLIFWVMKGLNSTSVFVALILSFIIFFCIGGYSNLLLYESHMSGVTRSNNSMTVIKDSLGHSIPFTGVVKLGRYLFERGYAQKLLDNPVVKAFSGVPNLNFNVTNNSCDGGVCGLS